MKRVLALASVLALVAVLAVPTTTVMAGTATEITATIAKAVEVTAPGNFSMGALSLTGATANTSNTFAVSANSANWTLTVHEAGGDGKMSCASPSDILTSAMQVEGGDQSGYTDLGGNGAMVTLVASTSTLSTAGTAQGTSISFSQPAVVYADLAGSYSITLTFTATAAAP